MGGKTASRQSQVVLLMWLELMSRGQGYLAKGHFPEVEEGYDY